MCGIFAYLNYDTPTNSKEIVKTLMNALKVLELKGYDSTGVALEIPSQTSDGGCKLTTYKLAGTVEKLNSMITNAKIPDQDIRSHVALAHTRWATHGEISDTNAHPMPSDEKNSFVVCMNGMIANYLEIKQQLIEAGMKFETETDTEVVAKLALAEYKKDEHQTFGLVMRNVCKQLKGAFAIAVMSSIYPQEMVVTSYGSNLVLGVNMYDKSPPPETRARAIGRTDSRSSLLQLARTSSSAVGVNKAEYFIASDPSALTEHTKTAIHLEAGDLLHFRNGRYQYYNFKDNVQVDKSKRSAKAIQNAVISADKGKYPHFILKEIHEQSESIANVLRGRVDFEKNTIKLGGLEEHLEAIRFCRRILFIASASSYHAALASRNIFEELTGLAITLELSTDFTDREPSVERNDVCVFISQSGETADVIAAVEFCKKSHALCVGITNTVGSPLSKMTDCGIYLNCGPEIGVASTKVYTTEIIAITLMALKLGENTISNQKRRIEVIQGMKSLSEMINQALSKEEDIKRIAATIKDKTSVLVMGRGYQFATCLEGALKLKEISSMHSEGVLSGELKHGPLALVDEEMPIIFVATQDKHYDQIKNSFSQVTARSGKPIVICNANDKTIPESFDKIEVPMTVDCLQCILNIIPLQLIAYYLGVIRGYDVDFSRSLAKVVTV